MAPHGALAALVALSTAGYRPPSTEEAPVRERDWIDRFVRPRAPAPAADGTLLGPGDDAALLALPAGEVAVLTVDGLVLGSHFLPGWLADDELAERLVAVTVSDLAAMGATPRGILLSFETPELPGHLGERFFAGLDRGLTRAGHLLGGNVVRTAGPLALTATAIGSARPGEVLRRDTARPGDTIAVSGLPGRAAWARERIARGEPQSADDRAAWVLPPDRVPLGRTLVAAGIRAAIDVSDGLLGDLGALLAASGAGADLELEPLAAACERAGIPLALALGGGEDYELCIAGERRAIEAAFAYCDLPPPLLLGKVRAESGVTLRRAGAPFEIDAPPWDPFRPNGA